MLTGGVGTSDVGEAESEGVGEGDGVDAGVSEGGGEAMVDVAVGSFGVWVGGAAL